MDVSQIQPQGQGGGAGDKTGASGLGGLFAQLLLAVAPADPATPETETGTEPQVAKPASHGRQNQDGTPQRQAPAAGETPDDGGTEKPLETALAAAPAAQPLTATPDQPQLPVVPTSPARPQGPAAGQAGTPGATPPPQVPTDTAAGSPSNTGASPQEPIDPESRLAKATPLAAPAGQAAGDEPQGQPGTPTEQKTATTPQPADTASATADNRLPTEADSAKPLDGMRTQTPTEATRPTPSEAAGPPQTSAQAGAATDPAATAQAAAQPAASAARQAQTGDPLSAASDEPSLEPRIGERSDTPSDRSSGKSADPVAPVLAGNAKPNPRQAAGQGNQQPGQQQPGPQTAANSGAPAQSDFLENLTTANQSARGFDLSFLSQVNVSSDAALQSFTLSSDGTSLVPTQQVSPTGSVELPGALPSRGAVVDPGAQLAVQISRAISAQTNRFSIKLDPPELGRIDVKLDFARDGTVRATVAAERPDTLDLLQKDVQSLERALRDAGTDPNKLSLNFSLQGEQSQGQMADQGQNDSASARDGTGEDDDSQSGVDGPDRYRPKADALVDLHV